MRKVLLQLDSSRLPSVFDRVVAYDGGADEVMSYGGVTEVDVRDLIHGCIFTRGPKDLKHTAVFVGGADIAVGEQLLAAATKAMFKPFTVSAMLDSNGSNTTAVAAVAKMVQAAGGGEVRGKRVLIVAGTGPVGIRAAGLFAQAGADVCITSRKADAGERARELVVKRFGGTVRAIAMPDAKEAIRACERAELLLNAGPAGVMLVPKQAWANRPGGVLKVVADVNAVPPLGIEGVDVMDDGVTKEGVVCFGALAIGNLKMKVHKACIARLFERNDLVLDAETIADVARELMAPKP
jgi:methylenetetrahydrofolate/methylenetetrahydromethanopterin dehydrogenase (NADP+)